MVNLIIGGYSIVLKVYMTHCKHEPQTVTIKFSVTTKCLTVANFGTQVSN